MNKKFSKHSSNRLTYAIDEMGALVNIDSVPTGNRCGCFCPACNEPLIAKNKGAIRIHHFAHQSGKECDYAVESMLHKLAKEKVREAFLSKSEFLIDFEYKSYCPDYEKCKFIRHGKCCDIKRQRFDIKRYYDSCEQEIQYDNINRRSDLKIFSSSNPNLPPIYLEFCVTHASDSEKLHSGNKIIEICLDSVADIQEMAENGIIESESQRNDWNENTEEDSRPIRFYGFKNSDRNNGFISSEIEFIRYILKESGKISWRQDRCNCKQLTKSNNASLLEICVHTYDSWGMNKIVGYYAFPKFKIPNCILCRNFVDKYNGLGKICRLYKYLQIPIDDYFNTVRARNCNCFIIYQKEMDDVLRNGLGKPFSIL